MSEKRVASTTGPLVGDLVVQSSNGVNANMAGTALPSTVTALLVLGTALPVTPTTTQSIVVPFSVQDTPSITGSSCIPLICMLQVTQPATPLINMPYTAGPFINMPLTAIQSTAMQPTAMPPLGTQSIMSVRPNQMGYLIGAPSNFNAQGTQLPYMPNPS